MKRLKAVGLVAVLAVTGTLTTVQAANENKSCVAYTKLDNLCITIPEFESYYKKYQQRVLSRVGKGNWYFNLSDEIAASKELLYQKILLHEAEKNKIENTPYYKKYLPEIRKEIKNIESYVQGLKKQGKINDKQARILESKLKERLINGYKEKAYLDMALKDAMKVTTDDINNFMMAHKGEYGFVPDPKNPKLKVIEKRQLVEGIREMKMEIATEQLKNYLTKKYGIVINKELLKELENKNKDKR